MKKPPIHALTSLRFFAALMVFLSHLNYFNRFENIAISSYFPEGYAGVTFFFILSGFILSYSYHDSIVSGKTSWGDFMVYRVSRIFPLHWLTLLIACCLLYFGSSPPPAFDLEKFLANFFLIQAFYSNIEITNSYNGVSWSLSAEMFFYVLFPLVIFLRTRLLLLAFFIVVSLTLAWLPIKFPHAAFSLPIFTSEAKYYAYFSPLCRFSDFLLGMVIYRLWRWMPHISNASASALQTTGIFLLLGFFMFHKNIDEVYRFDFYYAIPMAILVYAFSFQTGFFSALLSRKIFIILGEVSFAFYMIHQMVINSIAHTFLYNTSSFLFKKFMDDGAWHGWLNFTISIALSFALYYLFEMPSKKIFSRFLFSLKNNGQAQP